MNNINNVKIWSLLDIAGPTRRLYGFNRGLQLSLLFLSSSAALMREAKQITRSFIGCVSTLSQSRDSEAGFEFHVSTTLILKRYWPIAGIEPKLKSITSPGFKPCPNHLRHQGSYI